MKSVTPMLIAENKPPFDDDNYLYELKWDGVRCIAYPDFPGVRWLAPERVCIAEFMERTRRGGLRQPIYRGLRDDKAPEQCRYQE